MSLRIKSIKDFKGLSQSAKNSLAAQLGRTPERPSDGRKKAKGSMESGLDSGIKFKSTHVSKEKLKEFGPQEKLTQLIKMHFPDHVIEEDKKDAIPNRKLEIDIAFTDLKLAVEVDGWQYHGKYLSGFKKDREKQNLLVIHGWLILRFTNAQIKHGPMDCVETIRTCLNNIQNGRFGNGV